MNWANQLRRVLILVIPFFSLLANTSSNPNQESTQIQAWLQSITCELSIPVTVNDNPCKYYSNLQLSIEHLQFETIALSSKILHLDMSQQTPVLQPENIVPCVITTKMMSTTESNFSKTAEELASENVVSQLPSTKIMRTTESNFAKTADELPSENGDPQLTTLEYSQSLSQPIFSQTTVFSTSAPLLRGVSEILPTPPATPCADSQAVNASFDYQFNLPTSTPLNPITSLHSWRIQWLATLLQRQVSWQWTPSLQLNSSSNLVQRAILFNKYFPKFRGNEMDRVRMKKGMTS